MDAWTDKENVTCNITYHIYTYGASPVAQTVKNLPAVQETWVWFMGQNDPLKKEMATQLQNSCLENSMDRGARWAAVHGVAKSQTQLSN